MIDFQTVLNDEPWLLCHHQSVGLMYVKELNEQTVTELWTAYSLIYPGLCKTQYKAVPKVLSVAKQHVSLNTDHQSGHVMVMLNGVVIA